MDQTADQKHIKMVNRNALLKLAENINRCFTPAFGFPEDFVRARVNEKGDFFLYIGIRDLQVRSDGSFTGQGTDLTKDMEIKIHEAFMVPSE